MAMPARLDPLFRDIGEFMYWFSHLEYCLRVTLGSELGMFETDLRDELEAILSPYDFRTLCTVTQHVLLLTPKDQRVSDEKIKSIFKRCLALNDERNHVAHGTWSFEKGVKHVSRQSLNGRYHFEQPQALREKSKEVRSLISDVLGIWIVQGQPAV